MIRTPIMIVGAGPSGLMLSAQLQRHQAEHIVIDRKAGPTQHSKALGVQARTLEQYRQLGIADKALAQGFAAKNIRMIVNGRVRGAVPLGEIGGDISPYPFLFVLEQSCNEALLNDYIVEHEGEVRWGNELTQISKTKDGYQGVLTNSDGSQTAFECQYLIGCGGAHCPVRGFFDMPFRGQTNEQTFFVADLNIDVGLEKQGLLLVINKREFLAVFPMSNPSQYRVVGVWRDQAGDADEIEPGQLKAHIATNLGLPATIKEISWCSSYRVHHRVVDRFRVGNAFLVGDAAHIHSPAGGQGMNTGLGDATNLGWKLAGVVNGWAAPELLQSYNEERRPFAVKLVHSTDRAFTMMVSKHWLPQFVRTYLVPMAFNAILRIGRLRQLMFKTVSQISITYKKRGLRKPALSAGDRFPWFTWSTGNSFDWLYGPGYVVLEFGEADHHQVQGWSGPVKRITVEGPAAIAARSVGLPANGVVVVRPDMHIAYIVGHT